MSDERWMRPALAALVDDLDEATGRRALVDAAAFAGVRERVDKLLPGQVPGGDRGDNLVRALLALRVKFSPEEATAKLERNLAMRGAGPSPVDGPEGAASTAGPVGGGREPARGSPTSASSVAVSGSAGGLAISPGVVGEEVGLVRPPGGGEGAGA